MNNTTALVVDGRTRKLVTFVASVTRAQSDNPYQIILRYALSMGDLRSILSSTAEEVHDESGTRIEKKFVAEMPVILMGEYSARSSFGTVGVHSNGDGWSEEVFGHRKVLVVGGLGPVFGKGGLKVLTNPISATLVRGPVEIEELSGAENSNCASSDAACAGARLLANIDHKSAFMVEGQSDYTYVYRFRSTTDEGITEWQVEHHEQMFSRENIVRRIVFGHAYRELVHGRADYKPTSDEVKAVAGRRMESYLEARLSGDGRYLDKMGKSFGLLNMCDQAINVVAEELKI